jgi:thiol-disulfide isomerase/thioredoxin
LPEIQKDMKKLTVAMIAVAAMGVLACSSNDAKYAVTAVNAPKDGAVVYLMDQITSEPIDSAVVADGAYQMKGKAAKDAYLMVKTDDFDWNFLFFNDGQPVVLDYEAKTVTGSDLNNKLTECDLKNTDAYNEYVKIVRDFEALSEEEQDATMEDFIVKYRAALKKYSDFYMNLIEENKDNLVPVAFMERARSLASEEQFNELLESDAAFARHPYVLDLKRKIEESEAKQKEAEEKKQAIVGQKFIDLEEADPDGNLHKLSEYVGQGKWVLVDFWASWCGPCKNEMPNVVNAYKKYHDKGFEVVGLSFDREKEPWVKAITDWEMPWIHLSDLKYWKTVASDVYNVNSIPDNLLIDPEGTVVARCLRGEALEEKLDEIFD